MIVEIVFALLLAAAALTDLAIYRIPNALVAALIWLFVIVAAFRFSEVPWAGHLLAAALCLGIGLPLYRFGQMGAGDVKLMVAVALWSGLVALLPLLIFIALSGLAIMLSIVSLRYLVVAGRRFSLLSSDGELPRVLRHGEGIPYGMAIAVGALAAMRWFPGWLW